jgi:hypothetical protein
LFVKFVSRPPYLPALRNHNWKAFARVYNGPDFAVNRYDAKLAAAYARWNAQLAAAAPGRTAKAPAPRARGPVAKPTLPPGRESFAPVGEIRENPRRRNVRRRHRPARLESPQHRHRSARHALPNDLAPAKQQASLMPAPVSRGGDRIPARWTSASQAVSGYMLYAWRAAMASGPGTAPTAALLRGA